MSKDWNQAYEDADTPWDQGSASPPLLEFLAKSPVSGRVLVPGCGMGHDVRALAGQGADVIGMDIAPRAISQAKAFTRVGGERYVIDDFLNLGARHSAAYDWVVEHTCLCAIEPAERATYVESLHWAFKPGGQYLAVFFREVSDDTGKAPPYPISREESAALFSDVFEVVASFIPQQTYPSRPVGAEEVCWMRLRK